MSDYSNSPYYSTALAAAQQFGVPSELFVAQIGQESGFNPSARNGNAYGIAQFMPGTAAQYGVDVTDPLSSLYGAAKYDAKLYSQYGSWQSALQHYGTTANGNAPSVDAAAAGADNKPGILGTALGIGRFLIDPTQWSPSSASKDIKQGQGWEAALDSLLAILTDLPRMATLIVGLILLLAGLFMLGNRTIVAAVESIKP